MIGPDLAGLGPWPGEVVPLKLPVAAALFARRAERFRDLARDHAARDFLEAMADLCAAQRAALARVAPSPSGRDLPPQVPLRAVDWPRPGWRDALAAVLAGMAGASLPEAARAAEDRLARLPEGELEGFADALLAGATGRLDLAAVPFAAAAR